jgi:hypothetical protein
MTHTPGPWKVSDSHGLCVRQVDPGGAMVADLEPDSSVGEWMGPQIAAAYERKKMPPLLGAAR